MTSEFLSSCSGAGEPEFDSPLNETKLSDISGPDDFGVPGLSGVFCPEFSDDIEMIDGVGSGVVDPFLSEGAGEVDLDPELEVGLVVCPSVLFEGAGEADLDPDPEVCPDPSEVSGVSGLYGGLSGLYEGLSDLSELLSSVDPEGPTPFDLFSGFAG